MANTQTAFGFRHIGYMSGSSVDYQLATASILSSNTTKIFKGDPVRYNTTTGNIEQGAAASTQALAGVFDGCVYTPVGGTPQWSPFWPGAGAVAGSVTAYIINAPGALFQVAALLTPIVQANIGENVDFNIGTGNTSTGFSGATADAATLATTATLPFKVVGICTASGNFGIAGNGNDPTSNYNWIVVTFNNVITKQLSGA